MAFDKLIVRSLTGAAKSGIKMDLAIDSLKQKLTNETISKVQDKVQIPLPFSPVNVLALNQPLPSDLLTNDYISSLPPETLNKAQSLSEAEKVEINKTLDSLESTVNTIIQQKNSLQGALGTITQPLNTLENTTNTIQGVTTGLKTAVKVIKAIPIPTSVPPGVGIPVNVITKFSDSLDNLRIVINKFEGPLKVIPSSTTQINNILIPIVGKLQEFDTLFEKILNIIAFIRLLLKYPNITQSDIGQIQQDMSISLQQSLSLSGISTSNNLLNVVGDKDLLDQLDPNSNNPLFYKGFRLTIEFDSSNTFKFPARRIKAENPSGTKLYSTPPDQGSGEVNTSSTYSFSSSTNVLIAEVKFNIDQYLAKYPPIENTVQGLSSPSAAPASPPPPSTLSTSGTSGTSGTNGYLPFGTPGYVTGHVRFQGGKAWRWLGGGADKWVEHTISYEPIGRKGFYDFEEVFIKEQDPSPYPRAYYKWSELKQAWEFTRRVTG